MFSKRTPESPASSIANVLTLRYTLFFVIATLPLLLALGYFVRHAHLTHLDETHLAQAQKFDELAVRRKLQIMQKTFEREVEFVGSDRMLLRILSTNGTVLASAGGGLWQDSVSCTTDSGFPEPGGYNATTIPSPSGDADIRTITMTGRDGRVFQIAQTLDDIDYTMTILQRAGIAALILAIGLGSLLCFAALRRLTAKVLVVQETARSIETNDLTRRLPAKQGGDELDSLARSFNDMLDRIAALVGELKTLSSNVAHDLRAPIVRMRGTAELAVTSGADEQQLRESAGTVIEECDRLEHMISTMLLIARTEAGIATLEHAPTDMVAIMSQATDLFATLAEDKNVSIQLHTPTDSVIIHAHKGSLQRIVANLLDNAIKHGRIGGHVDLSCSRSSAEVTVTVADDGPGIPQADLPHIYERFYRAQQSRSSEGCGLGLSLVRALVKAHNGSISVDSKEGAGTRFTLRFPLAPSES